MDIATGCLTRKIPPQKLHQRIIDGELQNYNDYTDDLTSFSKILNYFHLVLNGQLVNAATLLHQVFKTLFYLHLNYL